MIKQMDAEGFGACSNHYECEASCPKDIPVTFISDMNRDVLKANTCHSDK
jgi:succinate dehydrogenase / fumarate reductase iron-sulfur subunit